VLLVNLLNGVFFASLVCFVVGALLLTLRAGRYSGDETTALLPNATRTGKYQARVRATFLDPRFRIGRILITAGGVVAVMSFVAMFVLSASLPRCADAPGGRDDAMSMCMPEAADTPA
jgi:hypothetical protein